MQTFAVEGKLAVVADRISAVVVGTFADKPSVPFVVGTFVGTFWLRMSVYV